MHESQSDVPTVLGMSHEYSAKQGARHLTSKLIQLTTHFAIALLCLFVSEAALSQSNVTVGAQVRPRFEVRNPVGGNWDTFTSMRLRAQVKASLERDVSLFVQLQDVRLWGDEIHPLFDFRGDNIDLHQGYAEFGNFGGSPFTIRAGRQEINFGGQRLVGAVGWTQQGQSFDGLRISTTSPKGRLDLVALKLTEASGGRNARDGAVIGAHGTITSSKRASVNLYGFYNHLDVVKTNQVTLGARLVGSNAKWTYRLETSYQTGERTGQDVAALMAGARLGYQVHEKGRVTLWYDYLSGDDNATDGKLKVFDTLFGTNHKFYGLADLFLNIPAHTGGLGLQDIALKAATTPHKDVTLGIDVHSFLLAKKAALSSGHLGEEIDVTMTYRYAKGVAFVGGLSYIIQDTALATIGRLTKNMTWGYLMTNVAF